MSVKTKPGKPYPEFPLTPHASGKWQKKIRGRIHYFGRWSEPEEALREYLAVKDYLFAGVTPPSKLEGFTVADACNNFYQQKYALRESGQLSDRALNDYFKVCDTIVNHFGKTRICSTLMPTEFAALKNKLSKKWGPVTLGEFIQRARMIFNWCANSKLIDDVDFGPDFRKPSRTKLRIDRSKKTKRLFAADEIRLMINNANPVMRAMILLAINSGFGQSDLAQLERKHVKANSELLRYPRPKTGIDRIVPIWPETKTALNEAAGARPSVVKNRNLFFVTRSGMPYVYDLPSGVHVDNVLANFDHLKAKVGIEGQRKGFYALRHTFQTVGEHSGDSLAVSMLMGHIDGSISAAYREDFPVARLVSVTEHVREWLFFKK